MAYQLAIAFAVVLLATSPVLAQESDPELELGGGWFQTNPFDVIYDLSGPAGPSANFAWTRWRNERTGITVGVTTVLSREGNDIVRRAFLHLRAHLMAATLAPKRRARLCPRRLGRRPDGSLGNQPRRQVDSQDAGAVPVARRAVLHQARTR